MNRRFRHIWIMAPFVVLLPACHSSAYNAGKADAEQAIEAGQPVIENYGIQSIRSAHEDAVLKEYGVSLWDRGCIANDADIEHERGMNETTRTWLKKRYGDDILKKIDDEINRRLHLEIDRKNPSP